MTKTKLEDLSYYPDPKASIPLRIVPEIENTKTLQTITYTRQRVTQFFETGKAHTTQLFDRVDPFYLRVGAIGSVVGLTLISAVARKRSRKPLKMILYPTITGGVTASFCFPNEASQMWGSVKEYIPDVAIPVPEPVNSYWQEVKSKWESLKKDRNRKDFGQSPPPTHASAPASMPKEGRNDTTNNVDDDDMYSTRR